MIIEQSVKMQQKRSIAFAKRHIGGSLGSIAYLPALLTFSRISITNPAAVCTPTKASLISLLETLSYITWLVNENSEFLGVAANRTWTSNNPFVTIAWFGNKKWCGWVVVLATPRIKCFVWAMSAPLSPSTSA